MINSKYKGEKMKTPQNLKTRVHEVDICVIGGGIGGMLTAISAARHGARVALMHDRPVLGGNASSEIRMWISGAGTRVRDLQETGIMEELQLENMYRNPKRNFSIWDSILYEMVRFEPNIELILNCTCNAAKTQGSAIKSVTGFQLTTYTWHEVSAKIFVDSSGDSILAPLTGAAYTVGREAKSEYGEEFGLDTADRHTMGMSILLQCRETDSPVSYTPPAWAYDFPTDDAMNNKPHNIYAINTNFYWIELGGMQNSIDDTEEIRDELLKIAFGVWDHIKNHGDHGAENWELEWVGFLPGKRESRRYVGDYVLTQHDVENCPRFADTVAYGGWQIDNHLPGGFHMDAKGGKHLQKRRLSEPYSIPLRALYSKNIDNLMFAGRNISASHIAFSSTRVMGTIGVIGQAVGTAAAIAVRHQLLPRDAAKTKIAEIQKALMDDDCFLPGFCREPSSLAQAAVLTADYGDPSALLNGMDRRIWGNDNGYFGKTNKAITYTFDSYTQINGVRLVFDSDLDREYTDGNPDALHTSSSMFFPKSYNNTSFGFPKCLIKHYKIEVMDNLGQWSTKIEVFDNHQRFIVHELNMMAKAVRLIPLSTYHSERKTEDYGSSTAHIFNFEIF
ncbi:MAG: FAD-dependent oxidoreductase [Ruminococcaceae bacterium]|nr:FAD-dependent oxidoreductase [Oscillospiraceae bacterium]